MEKALRVAHSRNLFIYKENYKNFNCFLKSDLLSEFFVHNINKRSCERLFILFSI